MATVNDAIILPAYVELGVIQDTSETISTTLRDNALLVLNQGIGRSSNERLLPWQVVHQTFTPVAGTSVYTLGNGGTFATTGSLRALAVTGWRAFSGNFSVGGEPVSFDELRKRQMNPTARRSVLPEAVAADQGYPLINVELFPVPDTSPGSLILDYWTPLSQYALYSDTVTVPEGFERFLVLMLASDLEPRFPIEGGRPELAKNYALSKEALTTRAAAIMATPPAPAA